MLFVDATVSDAIPLQHSSRDGRRARHLGLRKGWVCMLLTYAIGDVHGRSDLLQTVITFCEEDGARSGGTPRIIFLGDLVDRGRDAKGCLEIVGRALTDYPASVFLRGNHDDWFLRFLENDRRQLRTWFHDGGREAVDSYCDLDIDDARRFILSQHPGHLDLLRRSTFMVEEGALLFVHADIQPGIVLKAQSPEDLMWIREPFLKPSRQAASGHRPRPLGHESSAAGGHRESDIHGHGRLLDGPIVGSRNRSGRNKSYRSSRSMATADRSSKSILWNATAGMARCWMI